MLKSLDCHHSMDHYHNESYILINIHVSNLVLNTIWDFAVILHLSLFFSMSKYPYHNYIIFMLKSLDCHHSMDHYHNESYILINIYLHVYIAIISFMWCT